MKKSVKKELCDYIITLIGDGALTNKNRDEWHHNAFNNDYYLIGYYNAEKWLKDHDISVWEAFETVHEWEMDNLGEARNYTNAETLVNMLVYVYGEELLGSFNNINSVDKLRSICQS